MVVDKNQVIFFLSHYYNKDNMCHQFNVTIQNKVNIELLNKS